MMDHQRWEKVKDLFGQALTLTPEQRTLFLAKACKDDAALRSEVEGLLDHHGRAGSFLDGSPSQAFGIAIRQGRDEATFRPGEVVSERFRITSFIGQGGMGEVYEAEDLELREPVALKTVLPATLRQSDTLARFKREVYLARKVTHPNVCRIFDFYRHKSPRGTDVMFVSMELLRGETLADRITRQGRIKPEEALPLIRQMAAALGAAHACGIIHRDFKPSNVMLVAQPSGMRAVVTDFGLAARATQGDGGETVTGSSWLTLSEGRGLYGTLAYMAPEQIEGRPATRASDIYAFGLVIYEVLTGVRPFQGDSPISSAMKRLTTPPPPPTKLEPSISRAWESVILCCLERRPEDRFASVDEVVAELTLGTGPTRERPLKPVSPSSQRSTAGKVAVAVRRPRSWAFLLAGGVSILFLAIALRRWPLRQNEQLGSTGHVQYIQLTDFADAVTSPALSPDGRMLAMIRGENPFMGPGDIYVKLLPFGEPVQLTHDDHPKMQPVFTPDGSQIAFTRGEGWNWHTWTVPVLGGQPSELLSNASGLTWVAPHQVMFSEMGEQTYTKIVTAGESRINERDVYLPPANNMAHRSYLSPRSEWVLVVEMDNYGWAPCRLVPFAGGSMGKPVGPASASCTEAAWSPDGQWMYFAADAGNGFHIWQQQFPDGVPEQITFGATEERGIAVEPGGKSLITSVGSEQSTVWVHRRKMEQQISSEGFAYLPSLSADAMTLYYLVRTGGQKLTGELHSVNLNSGHKEQLLPANPIVSYAVSADGKQIVFTKRNAGGFYSIWISPVDRHSSPRQLVVAGAGKPVLSRTGDVFFVSLENGARYVFRMQQDGTGLQKVFPDPVIELINVSPDGHWIVVGAESGEPNRPENVLAYSLQGEPPRVLCRLCGVGDFQIDPPMVSWSLDQGAIYVSLAHNGASDRPKTMVIPLSSGEAFPKSEKHELVNNPDLERMSGVQSLDLSDVFPGPDRTTYAFWRTSTQRNLYRIGLP